MSRLVAFVAGLLVFMGWVRLVGNPHVVETVIGLVLGVGVGLWVYFTMKKIFRPKSTPPGESSK